MLAIVITIIVFIYIYKYFIDIITFEMPYRLGDVITYRTNYYYKYIEVLYKVHLSKYPNSIAAKYIKKTTKAYDIDTLNDIIKTEAIVRSIKPPDENLIIIHVRVGDVIEQKDIHTKVCDFYYVKKFEYYKTQLEKLSYFTESKRVLIIAGTHLNINLTKSKKYLKQLIKYIEDLGYTVDLKLSDSSKACPEYADFDFIFMSGSKYFISSAGKFSNVIKQVVQKRGNIAL
jgi:hypothetical protein